MLRYLHIRDFVIVDQAELSFEDGFTVFSGETGAGKSILIDALSLCLGARTDTGLIRENCDRADISAIFTAPIYLQNKLSELAIDDDEIILRRVIDKNGRSKAYINGIPATLSQIKDLGQQLVDIHGQHAHQSLLSTASQRNILDTQANLQGQLKELNSVWHKWQQAVDQLSAARANEHYQKEQLARLKIDIDYLEKIAPQENEWQELCNKQSKLAHGQALLNSANQAIEILDGEQQSANQAINAAIQTLKNVAKHDTKLNEFCESLTSAHIICSEIVSSLNSYIENLELDPETLSQYESRMSTMFEAARRFQTEPELLSELLINLYSQQDQLNLSTDISSLEKNCAKLEQQYMQLAEQISQIRQATALDLSAKVSQAMQDLSMMGGLLQINVKPIKPASYGIDEIEFLVAGHAGVKPKPLSKVASGGELARISLALSVIASQAARVPCLIFDEVDAGIGGAVAEVVGRLLKELGNRHQVLCVTHLPQVAACASHHYEVSKTSSNKQTLSIIKNLDNQGRVNEIARMLGGLNITDTTKKHAQEMLKAHL